MRALHDQNGSGVNSREQLKVEVPRRDPIRLRLRNLPRVSATNTLVRDRQSNNFFGTEALANCAYSCREPHLRCSRSKGRCEVLGDVRIDALTEVVNNYNSLSAFALRQRGSEMEQSGERRPVVPERDEAKFLPQLHG